MYFYLYDNNTSQYCNKFNKIFLKCLELSTNQIYLLAFKNNDLIIYNIIIIQVIGL